MDNVNLLDMFNDLEAVCKALVALNDAVQDYWPDFHGCDKEVLIAREFITARIYTRHMLPKGGKDER